MITTNYYKCGGCGNTVAEVHNCKFLDTNKKYKWKKLSERERRDLERRLLEKSLEHLYEENKRKYGRSR